jgi:hypothetical protein
MCECLNQRRYGCLLPAAAVLTASQLLQSEKHFLGGGSLWTVRMAQDTRSISRGAQVKGATICPRPHSLSPRTACGDKVPRSTAPWRMFIP